MNRMAIKTGVLSNIDSKLIFLALVFIGGLLLAFIQIRGWELVSGKATVAVLDDKATAERISASMKLSGTTDKAIEEIGIGGGIASNTQPKDYFDTSLSSDDLIVLQSGTVLYNSGGGYGDISVEDEIWFGENSPSVESSLSTTSVDKDYKDSVALEVDESSIYYYYVFNDPIDLTQIEEDDPLQITFLGKNMIVTGAEADRITVKIGESLYFAIGDEITTAGHTIKLEDVADGKVAVSVDGGPIVNIKENSAHKWSDGFEVLADSVFYKSGAPESSSANLIAGDDAATSYKDGDEFVGESSDDPYWEWVIADLDANTATSITAAGTATGPVLGFKNKFKVTGASQTDPSPILNKGCYGITLVDPYMQLCIDDLTAKSYVSVNMEVTNLDVSEAGGNFANAGSVSVLEIEADKSESLRISRAQLDGTAGYLADDAKTDTIYLMLNNTDGGAPLIDVFYKDSDNKVAIAGNMTGVGTIAVEPFAYIDYEKTKGTDVRFNMYGLDASGDFTLNVTAAAGEVVGDTDRIGVYISQASATAFDGCSGMVYVSDVLDATIDTQDENLRTKYGIVIKEPSSICSGDNVLEIDVPSDAERAKVSVDAYDSAEGVAISNAALLADQVALSDIKAGTILVGGPAANEFTARAMGKPFPTTGEELGWTPGWCYIKSHMLGGKSVVVVAGYEKEDTSACASRYIAGIRSSNGVIA